VGGQRHTPAALPPGKTRYPLYRRLGGPQGLSGRVRNISPPPGFDPRTVLPVTICYTDYAIPAQIYSYTLSLVSALDGVGGQRQASGRFTLGKDPVPFVKEAGWAGLGRCGESAPTGILSPARPARSESLYRLSNRGPPCCVMSYKSILQSVNTALCLGRIV
jgi:hypothetical protein